MSATVVGVLQRRGRFMVATPLFPRPGVAHRGRVNVARDPRAGEGDLGLLRVGGQGRGHARIVKRIGRPDVARDVIEALLLDRGMARSFDPFVEREAGARPRGNEPGRRDLRDLPTFTIDPATAKDFDDAISAEELGPGRWRIWVHIADVAAHVRPGSALDKEAYRRGTSVYVPGTVEPMLPHELSNGACSLVPGEDRLTVTVEFELEGATPRRAAFYRSRIRSDARLVYEQVDRIFDGTEQAREPWAAPLRAARAAADALGEARRHAGALTIESEEPEFEFDADGHVTTAREVAQTESHKLIEALMIAANEQVATHLAEHRTPTLYRVHETPDPASIEWLVAQLASLDVATPPLRKHLTPQQAGEVVGEISRLVDAHVRRTGRGRQALTSLVLRALKQAHYSPRNVGHAGLHSACYCHFTSPIRRYPDLVAHRALLSTIGGGEDPPKAARLEDAGTWTSARERDAMKLERSGDDIARCFLLERELFEHGWEQEFEGEIIGLISAGAFIAFGNGYEGMLPVRALRGEWWGINEEGTILTGTKSGHSVRLGDRVRVAVERVDAPRGRTDLRPVEL